MSVDKHYELIKSISNPRTSRTLIEFEPTYEPIHIMKNNNHYVSCLITMPTLKQVHQHTSYTKVIITQMILSNFVHKEIAINISFHIFWLELNEIFLSNPIDVFFQTKKQIEINTFINNIFKEQFGNGYMMYSLKLTDDV